MRILIVTKHYKPIVAPHSFRWSTIAEQWAQKNHDVKVIAGWEPGLLKQEVINNVQVVRVGGRITGRIRSSFKQAEQARQQTVIDWGEATSRTVKLLRWLHDHTWKQLYWPDAHCLWLVSALAEAHKCAKLSYDCIITASIPFTSHLVGLAYKTLFKDTTWLVDIADPFSLDDQYPQNNTTFYQQLNRLAETRVLEDADSIAVTCTETSDAYKATWPSLASKIHLIPHLANNKNPVETATKHLLNSRTTVLVFAGTLDGAVRNPDSLFAVVNNLKNRRIEIELHIYGQILNCDNLLEHYQHLLNTTLFCHGTVSKDEAFRRMVEADYLVNVGNDVKYQLPSKLVDYVQSGTPIINFVKRRNDPSATALASYNSVFNVICEPSRTIAELSMNVAAYLNTSSRSSESERTKWLSPFSLESIISQYEHCLKIH